MGTPVKQIVLSGYYGFDNSGDEAVLQSILNALKHEAEEQNQPIEPVVLSGNPDWTSRTYGVKAVHRMQFAAVREALKQSDGLISGGGSLLQDVTGLKTIPYYLGVIKLAQLLGKPTFIYAQGIGPVTRPVFRPLIRSVFSKCGYISVRDEDSKELLASMGLSRDKVEVVPDPVMGLRLPEDGDGSRLDGAAADLPVVGVSIRFWQEDRRELKAIADGLAAANRARPLHIRLLPFHLPLDDEASELLSGWIREDVTAAGGRVSIVKGAEHPLDMLREVGGCDMLIGMRLHSLIYAAGRRVPLLGISYDPKIDQFLGRLGESALADTGHVTSAAVEKAVLDLLDAAENWKERREPKIAGLVHEAEAPARRIIHYLRHEG